MKVYGIRRGCTQIGLVKRHLVWRRIKEAGDIFMACLDGGGKEGEWRGVE